MIAQARSGEQFLAGGRNDRAAAVLLLITLLYVVRIAGWMFSDLWFDEVITLTDYAVGPPTRHSLWRVFRSYPVANNHILFSALLWVWVRVTGFPLREWVLRLPSAVFGLLTVWYAGRRWRRFLGERSAVLAALTVALSPVIAPFMWQLRGYALSVFLSTVAATAALEMTEGCSDCGEHTGSLACALLPLVIPSNFLVVLALSIFVFTSPDPLRPTMRERLRRTAFLFVPGAVAAAYYLTLGPQFFRVLRTTGGWENGWLVSGHLALAFAVHAGPLLIVAIHSLTTRSRRRAVFNWTEGAPPGYLAACCGIVIILAALARRPAPFPRVFLPFFPLLTLSLFRAIRNHPVVRGTTNTLMTALVVAAWALAAERISAWRTRVLLVEDGRYAQNLLCQYYRGSTALSRTAAFMKRNGMADTGRVLVTFHDYPTFRFYWATAFGMPPEGVCCPDFPEKSAPPAITGPWRIFAVAPTPQHAADLFRMAGYLGPFQQVWNVEDRSLFVLAGEEVIPPSP